MTHSFRSPLQIISWRNNSKMFDIFFQAQCARIVYRTWMVWSVPACYKYNDLKSHGSQRLRKHPHSSRPRSVMSKLSKSPSFFEESSVDHMTAIPKLQVQPYPSVQLKNSKAKGKPIGVLTMPLLFQLPSSSVLRPSWLPLSSVQSS